MIEKPYGTWPSPITAARVAEAGLRLGGVTIDRGVVYWLEGRPMEGGRLALVRHAGGGAADVVPRDYNVRTRVHEYGGGAHVVHDGVAYFSNFADQRIYACSTTESQAVPSPLTPEGAWFFADGVVDARLGRMICVREDHTRTDREAETTLVSVPLQPGSNGPSAGRVLASGHDFFSTPRLSPDGSMLAWLCWDHPRMPWDGTELWVADVAADGSLDRERRIAGGPEESIYAPGWLPDGTLCFASDRTGWWQLYVAEPSGGGVRPMLRDAPPRSEFGRPQWVFGTQTWASAGPSRVVVSYTSGGRWHLAVVDRRTATLSPLLEELEPHEWLAADDRHLALVVSSGIEAPAVVRVDLESGARETLRSAATMELPREWISTAEAIEYPSAGGRTAYAFYYPPVNPECTAPAGERPPLITISHGGPTTATSATLDLRVQFWTSRGFAVVDVNYGGSSGFGREYRHLLRGAWGIVDVEDVVAVVRYLAESGKADPHRAIIRGGSAGGYTTLAALAFQPEVFKAGASYYGVSDIEVLARDTHKFESRYMDSLVGPYPAMRDEYRRRSPIHVADRLACPLAIFQGLEDRIVPPNQSEMMADAVRQKGLPLVYLTFEGEQHGFRKAATIARCLEVELYFYGVVFGFEPADRIEDVHIENR